MVAQDDYITIRPYKPPPQQVISWKKRGHEALAEAAQQTRGSGYLNEEQRECMMRCMAASRRVYREVAFSVFGSVFADVAHFLDGGRRRRSVWQRAREKLAASKADKAPAAAAPRPPPPPGSGGDTSNLLPCAIIYPNMHLTDRPELLKLLLAAMQQQGAAAGGGRASTLPPLGCTIRSTRHTTLASILRDLYLQIMAAVASLPAKAWGQQRRNEHRSRAAAAPQGTLGEVLWAYRTLVDGLAGIAAPAGKAGGGGASLAQDVPSPSLLLLFEDVEALSNRLLEDLLRLLAEASSALPARLVFLVSPAFSLAQNLGNGATATLEPATFALPPARVCFEKLLERLFLDVELPVMVSGQVLRFFRVTFLDLHSSITTFIRHLDFMLRVHFTQRMALLCMMPYDLVPESESGLVAAAVAMSSGGEAQAQVQASSSYSQASTAMAAASGGEPARPDEEGGGAGGEKTATSSPGGAGKNHLQPQENMVLVLTKAEGGIHDSHNLMVLRHLEALTKNPSLRALLAKLLASAAPSSASTATSDDRTRQFQCLRILVHQQLASRFELRIGCYLIHQALKGSCKGGKGGGEGPALPDMLHLLEVLLDHDRPQRWQRLERALFEGLAATSLEDVETLVMAWLELLRTLVEHMPPYARRFSKAINEWIARARELWMLLKALGKEMAKKNKRRKSKKGSAAAAAAAAAAASSSTPILDGAEADPNYDKQARDEKAAQEEEEEEEEARRLYRIKSQGITMDVQAFIADVITHCTKTLAQSSSFFKDAFWYRDSQAIQEVFFAQPRASAVGALNDSQSYLRCACCRPGELDPSMPDICIVYGLYEAHQGRTINLRAWFASFVDVICGQDEEEDEDGKGGKTRKRSKKQKAEDEAAAEAAAAAATSKGKGGHKNLKALWARFLHAVDELEHLGFTRPYGKKTGDRSKLIFAYTLLSARKQEQEQEELLLES